MIASDYLFLYVKILQLATIATAATDSLYQHMVEIITNVILIT